MKNNGIWYAVGAGVVGLGAWLFFAKKAEAQELVPAPVLAPIMPDVIPPNVPDKSNVIDEEYKQFIFDSPPLTQADVDRIRQFMATPSNVADWKAVANRLGQACLPGGSFITADFVPAPDGKAVMRMTFGYLGDIDPGAVKACMLRGGV
jgi:hypothetical protein